MTVKNIIIKQPQFFTYVGAEIYSDVADVLKWLLNLSKRYFCECEINSSWEGTEIDRKDFSLPRFIEEHDVAVYAREWK